MNNQQSNTAQESKLKMVSKEKLRMLDMVFINEQKLDYVCGNLEWMKKGGASLGQVPISHC